MKINIAAAAFRPVTITLETRDEVLAIAGLIGPSRALDRATALSRAMGELFDTLADLIMDTAE